MIYVLYNPLSSGGNGKVEAEAVKAHYDGRELTFLDVTEMNGYADFFKTLTQEDSIVICGGDGTLNRFVNEAEALPNVNIYYFATGTGNDFGTDIGYKKGDAPVLINEYIVGLPTVSVNGKEYKVLNGVGFGIDGYCCEVGDRQRAEGKKPNYTSIAITGLLFHYKPCDATVIVDGVEHTFKKVWIAPTMHGRYYGGGMIAAPDQKRGSGKVTVVLMYKAGRLPTLVVFPSIFKGEHVKHTKTVAAIEGKEITVRFTEPKSLQVDGETILNVTEYTVKA